MCTEILHNAIPTTNRTFTVNSRDPSQTTALRGAFVSQMNKRFRWLRGQITKAVDEEDVFGLRNNGQEITHLATPGRRAFDFRRSSDKVSAFMAWLQVQIDNGILSVSNFSQVGQGVEKAWTNLYIQDSYSRGVTRARYQLNRGGFDVPTLAETGGIVASMGLPFHIDRVGLLYTRTFNELKNITNAMSNQMSKVLAQGMVDGLGPSTLARHLNAVIRGGGHTLGITDTLGRFIPAERRAQMLARTEIIRAHAEAQLQEYKNWGVEGVNVKAEWITAGDNRVCNECADLEGSVFPLSVAQNMIPLHPNCRCAWLPWKDPGGTPTASIADEELETITVKGKTFKQAPYTPSERAAALEYQSGAYDSTTGGFTTLQSYLRTGKIPRHVLDDGVTANQVRSIIKGVDGAIAKTFTAEDMIVYRGIRNTAEAFGITSSADLKVGLTFKEIGYTSTSLERKVANKFATKLNRWEDPRVLQIHLKEGQNALPMNLLEDIGESEIVLPRGLRFRIIRITNKTIDIEIVN